MDSFRDRVVLITGAGSGIGRQLARTLASEGARIGDLDRQAEPLETLKTDLTGRECASAVADVTDLSALRSAVAGIEARTGPTDLLIACAGVGRETSALSFSAEDINALIAVNLLGVVNSIDAVLPGMKQRRSGHLVALSSLASYRGLPRMAGYCASKAGVNALMDSLRAELKPLGIACTTVCPGWIRTPMTAPLGLPPKMLLDVEVAVGYIVKAIRARRAFIAFPPSGVRQAGLLRWLPLGMGDWLACRYLARSPIRLKDPIQ
jgi:NAD(P)-dependent dehydrogenase (short-subunit alcohol dehydrogenase family)